MFVLFFFCRPEVQTVTTEGARLRAKATEAATTEGTRPRATTTAAATTEGERPRATATAAATTTEGVRPRQTTAATTARIADFFESNLAQATAREQQNTQPTRGTRPRTVNTLRNTVRTPVFSQRLPKTVQDCVHEYVQNNLVEWEGTRMTMWEQKVKQAYGRRAYLQQIIRARARRLTMGTREQRMERAAETMENERVTQGISVSEYLKYLKKHDPKVRKRKIGDRQPL